jgi:hypothetical protein
MNEAQRRHILVTFRGLDELLAETDERLGAEAGEMLFPSYVADAAPIQKKRTADYARRLRKTMSGFLERTGIPAQQANVSAIWSARTLLMSAQVAMADLEPQRLNGYGNLPDEDARELRALVAELASWLDQMEAYLAQGPDETIALRLRRIGIADVEAANLIDLERIVSNHGLAGFHSALEQFADRLAEPAFEIAVFGRVKAGKSSLLNWLLETGALPTGVTPVTEIPVRIVYGEAPLGHARFTDAMEQVFDLARLAEFVSAQQNPGNTRHVTRLNVELPVPLLRDGAAFVDTPGIGLADDIAAAETWALPAALRPGSGAGGCGLHLDRRRHRPDRRTGPCRRQGSGFVGQVGPARRGGSRPCARLRPPPSRGAPRHGSAGPSGQHPGDGDGADRALARIGPATADRRWPPSRRGGPRPQIRPAAGCSARGAGRTPGRRSHGDGAGGTAPKRNRTAVERGSGQSGRRARSPPRDIAELAAQAGSALDEATHNAALIWNEHRTPDFDATSFIEASAQARAGVAATAAARQLADLRALAQAALAEAKQTATEALPKASAMPIMDASGALPPFVVHRSIVLGFVGEAALRLALRHWMRTKGMDRRLAETFEHYGHRLEKWRLAALAELRAAFLAQRSLAVEVADDDKKDGSGIAEDIRLLDAMGLDSVS